MPGIFPNSGVPANQAAGSVDVPTTGCQELFHDTGRCPPRFDAAAANSLMSEILNVIAASGRSYNCDNLTNLRDAINAMLSTLSPCSATVPAATNAVLSAMAVSPGLMHFLVCHADGTPTTVKINGADLATILGIDELSPCSSTVPDATAAVITNMQNNPALLRLNVCHSDGTPSVVQLDGAALIQILSATAAGVTNGAAFPAHTEDTKGTTGAYVKRAMDTVSACAAPLITATELTALQDNLSTSKLAVCIPSGAGSKVVSVPADDLLSSAGFNHMGAVQRAVLQGPLAVMYDDGSAFTPAEVAPYASTFTVPAGVTHVALRIEVGVDEYESVTIVPVSTGDTISAAPASGQPRLNGVLMDGAFLQANGVQPVLVPDFEIGHLGTTLNGTALWQAANTRYTIMGCTLV